MSEGHHGVCEKCGKRSYLCLFRSEPTPAIPRAKWHPIQTIAVALCGDCAVAIGFSRWFESLPVTPIESAP